MNIKKEAFHIEALEQFFNSKSWHVEMELEITTFYGLHGTDDAEINDYVTGRMRVALSQESRNPQIPEYINPILQAFECELDFCAEVIFDEDEKEYELGSFDVDEDCEFKMLTKNFTHNLTDADVKDYFDRCVNFSNDAETVEKILDFANAQK